MRYWLVHWHHDHPDEPVWMAHEVTKEQSVPRMIEHYQDGRTTCRASVDEGWHTLVDQPFVGPMPDDDEFTSTEISAEEFERRWISPH